MARVKAEGAPIRDTAPQSEVSPTFKYYLETVVACGPHPSDDRDVIIFESGFYLKAGAAHCEPGDKVVWVTKDNGVDTVGVFGAQVQDNRIAIQKIRRLSPLLISVTDRERAVKEAEINTVPLIIPLADATVPEDNMKIAEEMIAQMPPASTKRLPKVD